MMQNRSAEIVFGKIDSFRGIGRRGDLTEFPP